MTRTDRPVVELTGVSKTFAATSPGATPVQALTGVDLTISKGEFISLVKMTSIVGYIAVQDVTKASDIIRSRTFDAFFPLVVVAVIYFVIAAVLTQGLEVDLGPVGLRVGLEFQHDVLDGGERGLARRTLRGRRHHGVVIHALPAGGRAGEHDEGEGGDDAMTMHVGLLTLIRRSWTEAEWH